MGSKNISISDDAYLRLRRAKKSPSESFSDVIRRGYWDNDRSTAGAWLENFNDIPPVSDAILDELDANQKYDKPPEDKWSC